MTSTRLLKLFDESIPEHAQLKTYIDENYKADGDINDVDEKGYTRLSWAAYYGDLRMVKSLLELKADAESKFPPECPLMRAAEKGHFDICKELILKGSNWNFVIIHKGLSNSILSCAIKQDKKDFVEYIFNLPDFDINEMIAREIFILTMLLNKMDFFMLFINKGIDVNFLHPKMPLIVAAKDNNLAMLQILIEKGANLAARDWAKGFPNKCAYDYAHINKSLPAIKLLIEPLLSEEKYIGEDLIDSNGLLKDLLSYGTGPAVSDAETADKYTLLKLFYEQQQKVKKLNNPRLLLFGDGFKKLKSELDQISKNNKNICAEVDAALSNLSKRLPDVLLNMIDDYGHPHAHLKK